MNSRILGALIAVLCLVTGSLSFILPAHADVDIGSSGRSTPSPPPPSPTPTSPSVQKTLEIPGREGSGRDGEKPATSKKEYESRKEALARFKTCMAEAGNDSDQQDECRKILPPDMIYCVGGCDLVDPGTVARKVVARLELSGSTPQFGPDPDINQIAPGKLVVKFPYWLTVPGNSTHTTTATADGLTLRLDARRTQVVFTMGDDTTTTCTETRPWPGPDRGIDRRGEPIASPVCGHRYASPGRYTITATVSWEVTWTGAGQTGIIPVTHSGTITHEVIELHSVVR